MNRYGQSITWGTLDAPHPFTGICQTVSYQEQFQRLLDEDESGDYRALVQHSKRARMSFSAKVTDESTDFLDLSSGAAITVTGVSGGLILASRAVERWSLGQPKTASIEGTHYPDMSATAAVSAGTSLNAFTPSQAGLGLIAPAAKLIYGTFGFTHAAGVVHEVELTQELAIAEDDPSPAGQIVGAASHGYMRSLRLRLLAKPSAAKPQTGAALVLPDGPVHTSGYRIESVQETFAEKRGKMYDIGAVWIQPLTEG